MRKLFTLMISIVLLVSTAAPAVAASVSGLLAGTADGSYYLYDYQELLDSYALKLIGRPNGLYEDYNSKLPVAFLHGNGIYIDYHDTLDYYAGTVITGQNFDFNSFAQGAKSKKLDTPLNLFRVSVLHGQLTSQAVNNKPSASIDTATPPVTAGTSVAALPDATASYGQIESSEGIPIVGVSQVSLARALEWAAGKNAHPRFIEIAPLYWDFGRLTGICPEVLYAQAAHETRFGHFTGQVPPAFNNWAGIKTANAAGDNPEDHEQFASPSDGVRAHFNHIAAYVGLDPIGEKHDRYHVVTRLSWAGTVKTVEELSGKWAPSANYHERIVVFLSEMRQ